MSAITIMAVLQAKEGKEQELFDELQKVISPSRAEEGCIEYTLHQSMDDNGTFAFYETWKDEAALQAHIESTHYQTYRLAVEGLIEKREVHRLHKVAQ
ncbi:putative quinol monooxygenase [Metabacillus iocasae]|uniref:Quinol monooxygenase YgiN n=1 Tax=Priestia iocasae TaxID=2291674 RepID=A0ABS2R1A8_9BACI|nr:putative quinol monooxygenase [Metabacillus iocasae]MBM7705037.1 quinol monooxygenase YgiN [Metabacillus iocasae]